jgi:ATP-dependent DNA ligase
MPGKQALHKQAAGFIDTMDCLPVSRLPEGPEWTYEIKLDGYRLEVCRVLVERPSISREDIVIGIAIQRLLKPVSRSCAV